MAWVEDGPLPLIKEILSSPVKIFALIDHHHHHHPCYPHLWTFLLCLMTTTDAPSCREQTETLSIAIVKTLFDSIRTLSDIVWHYLTLSVIIETLSRQSRFTCSVSLWVGRIPNTPSCRPQVQLSFVPFEPWRWQIVIHMNFNKQIAKS